jgi:hypothetical protein
MADSKISALPASTTPLAGTEVLPIVQSSTTRQVSVANLTAGRAISATQLTLTTGNLIVANGQGVDFSATPGTGTSELFADYEEGTWTMGVSFGGGTTGITYTVNTGRYIKVGKSVTVTGFILLSSKGSSTGAAQITGLPYTIGAGNPSQSAGAVRFGNSTFTGQYYFVGSIGTTNLDGGVDNGVTGTPANLTNTNFANNSLIIMSYTYFVD